MEKEKSAGSIIFKRDHNIKYLLIQYGLGHWEFARGNIEENESEKEAAVREIKEETSISDLNFIEGFNEKISFFYKIKNMLVKKEVVYFLAETKTEKVKLSYEHKDYRWLPLEEAVKLLKFNNVKQVLEKAHKHLLKILKQKTIDEF